MDLGDCLLALTANCVLSASDAADHGPDSHARIHPRPPKSGKNVVYMDIHVAPLDVSPDALAKPIADGQGG